MPGCVNQLYCKLVCYECSYRVCLCICCYFRLPLRHYVIYAAICSVCARIRVHVPISLFDMEKTPGFCFSSLRQSNTKTEFWCLTPGSVGTSNTKLVFLVSTDWGVLIVSGGCFGLSRVSAGALTSCVRMYNADLTVNVMLLFPLRIDILL